MFGYEPNDRTLDGTRQERTYFVDGSFVEFRATPVPRTEAFPEGVKYAYQYVAADGTPMLRYDNAHGEHERHEGPDGDGEPIPFAGHVLEHYDRFLADVYQRKGGWIR
jgi:hypothetical protein